MSNLAIHPALAVAHPSWFDLQWCETDETNTHHVSAATRWRTLDAEGEVSLRRTDEHDYPDEATSTEVAFWLDSTSTVRTGAGVQVYFTPDEARDAACRLIAMAASAEAVTA